MQKDLEQNSDDMSFLDSIDEEDVRDKDEKVNILQNQGMLELSN